MSLNYDQIADLVLTTQDLLIKRGAFVDLQTDLTDYVAVREMWEKRKKKFDGGLDWAFQAQTDHNHSAKAVGMYETDSSAFTDNMIEGKVGPKFVNANMVFDLRERALQGSAEQIVDYVESKYIAMMISFYELLETYLWSKPVNSSDDKKPYGIQYWITKGASEGFNGVDPVGFSSGRAGISSTNYPRWANFTNTYSAVSKTDLLRAMRRAHKKTRFRSPVSHANPDLSTMGNGIYVNLDTSTVLEEIAEDQNMNIGKDLSTNGAFFKSSPIIYAPKLDDDTDDPVYMIDWKTMAIGTAPGWENNITKPYAVPNKHLVRRSDLDVTLNMVCTDLRKQAVIVKA